MPHHILILDDERNICETMADYFNDMGHRASAYTTGEEAYKALQIREFTVAIIDIRLPDMCGFTFIDHARLIRPDMRYILHTGSLDYDASGKLHQHADSHIEAVLVKPVRQLQEFSNILDRLEATA